MDRSPFFKNDRFVSTKKTKNETIVFKNNRYLMEIVLKNGRFKNDRFNK